MHTLRNNRTLHQTEVVDIIDVTPRMRRITIVGESLPLLGIRLPGQWMKVFVPTPGDEPPAGRAYTIRQFDRAAGRIAFDVVLHGDDGPGSRWAGRARRGDRLDVGGPRAGHMIDRGAASYILAGDATALPAIAAILDALPDGCRAAAFLEVADKAEERYLTPRPDQTITWLHSGTFVPGTTGLIERAVKAASLETEDCQVWIAGESSMMRSIRAHLLLDRRVIHPAIESAGYWKLGTADHRERD